MEHCTTTGVDVSDRTSKICVMTKAGNDLVRRVLVECANVVMKSGAKDTDLKLKGLRIGARGGLICLLRLAVCRAAAGTDLADEARVQELLERSLHRGFADVRTYFKELGFCEFPDRPVYRIADAVGLRHFSSDNVCYAFLERAVAFEQKPQKVSHKRFRIVVAVKPSGGRSSQSVIVGLLGFLYHHLNGYVFADYVSCVI